MNLSNSTLRPQVKYVCLRFLILVLLMTLYHVSHGFLDNNIGTDLDPLSVIVL